MEIDEMILEKQRRECWLKAWAATASAISCPKYETATKWADEALKAFDERFVNPKKK